MPLGAELGSSVRPVRYRPRLTRRTRVKTGGVHEVISERLRTAARSKAVVFEGEIDQVGAHHTDVFEVRGGRGIAPAISFPHGEGVAQLPSSVRRPKQLVGRLHYVFCVSHVAVTSSLVEYPSPLS